MSGRFNIVSRNGLLRADTEDGERLQLRIYPPNAPDAAAWETSFHVNLSDLRQIVNYFDSLGIDEPVDPPEISEEEARRLAKAIAPHLAHVVRNATGNKKF